MEILVVVCREVARIEENVVEERLLKREEGRARGAQWRGMRGRNIFPFLDGAGRLARGIEDGALPLDLEIDWFAGHLG